MSIYKGTQLIASSNSSFANLDLSNLSTTGNTAIVHNAMPSTSGTALTVGASGATYQMTDDGYLYAYGNNAQSTTAYVQLGSNSVVNACWINASGNSGNTFIPVSKGDTVSLYYYQFASVGLIFRKANGNE